MTSQTTDGHNTVALAYARPYYIFWCVTKYFTLHYITLRLFTTKADTKKRNRTDRQRTEFTI